jgi:hypothetical protein
MIRKPIIEQRYYCASTPKFCGIRDRLKSNGYVKTAPWEDNACRKIKAEIRTLNRAWVALPEADRIATIAKLKWWKL